MASNLLTFATFNLGLGLASGAMGGGGLVKRPVVFGTIGCCELAGLKVGRDGVVLAVGRGGVGLAVGRGGVVFFLVGVNTGPVSRSTF